MSVLAVLVLGAAAVLVLVLAGSVWAMNKAAARLVGEKHRAMECIVDTGEVPAAWVAPFWRRLARLHEGPGNQVQIRRLQEQAKRRYVQELGALIDYARKTTLVEDEETRETLLAELESVHGKWEARSAAAFWSAG